MTKLPLESIIDDTPIPLEIGEEKFQFRKISVSQLLRLNKHEQNSFPQLEEALTILKENVKTNKERFIEILEMATQEGMVAIVDSVFISTLESQNHDQKSTTH